MTDLRIRSDWPALLRSDLDYFCIPIYIISKRSLISEWRIHQIMKENEAKYSELNSLTIAFNKIINERMKCQAQ